MKKTPILIAAFILGSFAVGGVGLVAITHELTDAKIAENQRQAMLAKLKAIVPEGRMSNDPLADRIEVRAPELLGGPVTDIYRVRDGDEPVALILEPIVPDGYAGPIRLLVSVLRDGSLGGVRVLSHFETPGLGDKIEERKDSWIVEQFEGRSLGEPPLEQWRVKRDGGVFDQFTGATITPRSVVKAVKGTLLFVQRHGEALYARPVDGQTEEAVEPVQAAAASDAGQVAPPPAAPAAAPTPTAVPAAAPTPAAPAPTTSAPAAQEAF